MTRILDLEHASSHGTPVYVTVWDLTPPSMWTSAARGLGLGVFHTNVWFPDLSVEWAFGGHGYRDVSGIFSIPRDPIVLDAVHERVLAAVSDDSAAVLAQKPHTLDGLSWLRPEDIPAPGSPPLPGAQYMGAYFVGYAGRFGQPSRPHAEVQPWASAQSGKAAFREPAALVEPYFTRASSVLARRGGATYLHSISATLQSPSKHAEGRSDRRHPRHRGARLASVAHVQATMQELRNDADWMGPTYDLVSHNCNHFADTVCRRLTGAALPAWINRSAALGRNLIWAIPKSILDIDTRVPLEDDDLTDLDYATTLDTQ